MDISEKGIIRFPISRFQHKNVGDLEPFFGYLLFTPYIESKSILYFGVNILTSFMSVLTDSETNPV